MHDDGPGARKLPVTAAWQVPVLQAIDDLSARLGVARERVAVTRVDGEPEAALEIWLLAGGRSFRYRAVGGEVTAADGGAAPDPGRAAGARPPA